MQPFEQPVAESRYSPVAHRLILWATAAGATIFTVVAAVVPLDRGAGGVHWMAAPQSFRVAALVILLASVVVTRLLHARATVRPPRQAQVAASLIIVAVAEAAALLGAVCIMTFHDPSISVIALPWLIALVIVYSPRS